MKPTNYLHYKNYVGSVEFSGEDMLFHGKIIGTNSLISFEGDSVASLVEDFHNAVDEYIAFCSDNNIDPHLHELKQP